MSQSITQHYGIGAVAQRTGLSTSNIRMWEARYRAVVPERTESNRRLYSVEDVDRLILLRSLTERGHAINTIANLSVDELRSRIGEERDQSVPFSPLPPQRVTVIGAGLESLQSDSAITVNRVSADPGKLPSKDERTACDLLVMEFESLFPETLKSVRELMQQSPAARCLVVYHFSPSSTTGMLARSMPGMKLIKAPLSPEQLRRECLVHLASAEAEGLNIDFSPIPEHLFSKEQLVRFARLSTSVDCECPQHLAGLLQSLSAFETYSRQCEDRNPKDAVLHTFLHRTTAQVRRSMEEALQHVLRVEGIAADDSS